jgi:hypothetical protein
MRTALISPFFWGWVLSKLLLLKSASSLSDIASLLGFSPSGLSFVLYKQDALAKYQKFEIPKKSGGTREICAPIGAMKAIQRELATVLNACRAEILEAIVTPLRSARAITILVCRPLSTNRWSANASGAIL